MIKTYDIRFASLTTKQLLLRPLNEADQATIFLLRSDAQVNHYLDRPPCLTPEDALLFIKKIQDCILKQEGMYWAICLKDNKILIGTICLFNFSEQYKNAEIGFELIPSFQGKGLMQEALAAILSLSFEILKIQIISAVSHIDNKPSINLLKKNDFKMIEGSATKGNDAPEDFIHFRLQNSPSNI